MKKHLPYLFFLLFCSSVFANINSNIKTIKTGVLKVAVTGICKDASPHHNCWIYKLFLSFAEKNNLSLELIKVSFDNSWKLSDENKVDVVATGITPLPERSLGRATYSDTYFIVKRGIKIKRADGAKFKVMTDFKGYSLAAGKGMTSEKDLRNRAVKDINLITPETWEEVYKLFNEGKVAGIAEGFYFFPEDKNKNDINLDENTMMIDVHDLELNKIEGLRFVVRDASTNVLIKLNEHIKNLELPNHRPTW